MDIGQGAQELTLGNLTVDLRGNASRAQTVASRLDGMLNRLDGRPPSAGEGPDKVEVESPVQAGLAGLQDVHNDLRINDQRMDKLLERLDGLL